MPNRRQFLSALIAAPVLARIMPTLSIAEPAEFTYVSVIRSPFLTANVWTPGPQLTEAMVLRCCDEMFRVTSISKGKIVVKRGY